MKARRLKLQKVKKKKKRPEFFYLQSMINSRMNINKRISRIFLTSLFLVLSANILIVIRQGHVEIKRLVPLIKPEPNEGVFPIPVLNLEHEVPGRIERGLYGTLALARVDKTSGE